MYSRAIFQQKLAKREGGGIDRSQDIARLQEFYKLYREKHNVDKLREEEMKLRESGAFSGNLGEYVSDIWNSIICISFVKVMLSLPALSSLLLLHLLPLSSSLCCVISMISSYLFIYVSHVFPSIVECLIGASRV